MLYQREILETNILSQNEWLFVRQFYSQNEIASFLASFIFLLLPRLDPDEV